METYLTLLEAVDKMPKWLQMDMLKRFSTRKEMNFELPDKLDMERVLTYIERSTWETSRTTNLRMAKASIRITGEILTYPFDAERMPQPLSMTIRTRMTKILNAKDITNARKRFLIFATSKMQKPMASFSKEGKNKPMNWEKMFGTFSQEIDKIENPKIRRIARRAIGRGRASDKCFGKEHLMMEVFGTENPELTRQ